MTPRRWGQARPAGDMSMLASRAAARAVAAAGRGVEAHAAAAAAAVDADAAAGQVVFVAAAGLGWMSPAASVGRHHAGRRRPGSCRTSTAPGGGPRPLDWCWAAGAEETQTWAERDMPLAERRCRALPFAWPKSGRLRIAPGLIHLGAGRAEYTTYLDLCLWLAWMTVTPRGRVGCPESSLTPHVLRDDGLSLPCLACVVVRRCLVWRCVVAKEFSSG